MFHALCTQSGRAGAPVATPSLTRTKCKGRKASVTRAANGSQIGPQRLCWQVRQTGSRTRLAPTAGLPPVAASALRCGAGKGAAQAHGARTLCVGCGAGALTRAHLQTPKVLCGSITKGGVVLVQTIPNASDATLSFGQVCRESFFGVWTSHGATQTQGRRGGGVGWSERSWVGAGRGGGPGAGWGRRATIHKFRVC
jgi:hypothetical protein